METQKHPPDAAREVARDGEVAKPSDDQDHPLTQEESLEEALSDSMDASDPPCATQPGDHGDPVPSSGFPEEDPDKKDRKARHGQ
ncbi:hypothetical protein [Sphingobium phenoxybenzoativorans]|uniref:hypothetical protein n=1 Tax=Sphingobium phenoxybenzoativorans TaxID=1592790 RepID=UPI001FE7E5CD|nr:hypothetical protein [Sphingobium phenoxybenzoativorans]